MFKVEHLHFRVADLSARFLACNPNDSAMTAAAKRQQPARFARPAASLVLALVVLACIKWSQLQPAKSPLGPAAQLVRAAELFGALGGSEPELPLDQEQHASKRQTPAKAAAALRVPLQPPSRGVMSSWQ